MYNPQLLSFESTDRLTLPGLLYNPTSPSKKVALFLHGNGSSSVFYKTHFIPTLAEGFNSNGIAFFPFNNRGAHYIKTLKRMLDEVEVREDYGMAYELIKECVYDVDGAINFLKTKGYEEFYLIGHSTGANKIVVYNKYNPQNEVTKYILLAGGDDSGLYYESMGREKFTQALEVCKKMVEKGKGRRLVPKIYSSTPLSYQSLLDTIDPDGDYNIFPFNEEMNGTNLATKELFSEFDSISKPTLVIYGENDEYCYGDVKGCVKLLKDHVSTSDNFRFAIIPGADHGFSGSETELTTHIIEYLI